jgi:recombination protein RecT
MADNPEKPGSDQQALPIDEGLRTVREVELDKAAIAEQAAQNLSQKQPTISIRDQIQGPEFKKAIAALIPKTMRVDRVVRVALNAMMRMPDLAECSKPSFFRALLDCASYGLEPDGRRAHLIPFRNRKMCACGHEMDTHKGNDCSKCDCRQRRTLVECQLIIDYKGLAELVRRSGEVSIIHADVVYENDEWSYGFGSEAHLRHKPNLRDRGTGKIAYYSYVRLKDGSEDFVVLSPAEVEKVRRRSKSPDAGPWVTDYDEMGKKTAFRRHSKWLPLSPEVRNAIERDDEAVDVSGWEELTEPSQQQIEPPRQTLRDKIIAQGASLEKGTRPTEES